MLLFCCCVACGTDGQALQAVYGQCGGKHWKGYTLCEAALWWALGLGSALDTNRYGGTVCAIWIGDLVLMSYLGLLSPQKCSTSMFLLPTPWPKQPAPSTYRCRQPTKLSSTQPNPTHPPHVGRVLHTAFDVPHRFVCRECACEAGAVCNARVKE